MKNELFQKMSSIFSGLSFGDLQHIAKMTILTGYYLFFLDILGMNFVNCDSAFNARNIGSIPTTITIVTNKN